AATAGELSSGTITYRMNAAGLADLSAKRTYQGKTVAVQATARLTDTDLGLLRINHFSEDDAATVASARPDGWRGDAATAAHSIMQLLAFLTGIAGALMGVAYV